MADNHILAYADAPIPPENANVAGMADNNGRAPVAVANDLPPVVADGPPPIVGSRHSPGTGERPPFNPNTGWMQI